MARGLMMAVRPLQPAGEPEPDPLNIALWQVHGYHSGYVTMTRPGGAGPLILAHDGVSDVATLVGLALTGSSFTNCLVKAEILIKGWDPGTLGDVICGGPALRMGGTVGSTTQRAYFGYSRTISGSSRRTGCRYVNGASAGIVGAETSSLPSTWADGSTHLEMEIEANGGDITTRAKLKGAGSWVRNETSTRADGLDGPGMVGIFCHKLAPGMSLEIHDFSVTEIV